MDLAPQCFQRCHPAAERQLRLHHLAAAPPAQAHHRQLLPGDGPVRAVQRPRADQGDERAGDPDRQQAHSAGAPPAISSSSFSLSSTLFLARSKFRLQLTRISCAVFAAIPRSTSEESALLPWTNAWSTTLA